MSRLSSKKTFGPAMLEKILASLVIEKWRFSVLYVCIGNLFLKKYSIMEHENLIYCKDSCFTSNQLFD